MSEATAATTAIREWIAAAGLESEESAPGTFVVEMPGEHKLKTTTSLVVGTHSLSINAFVARHPDENREGVFQWLLERNRRMYAVAYAIDQLGDIYVTGRIPLAAVTVEELDRIMGAVLDASDGAFNTLLELGFMSAIRREWDWRTSRGESTANLEAFRHLLEDSD